MEAFWLNVEFHIIIINRNDNEAKRQINIGIKLIFIQKEDNIVDNTSY